jgi:hypothetical protein
MLQWPTGAHGGCDGFCTSFIIEPIESIKEQKLKVENGEQRNSESYTKYFSTGFCRHCFTKEVKLRKIKGAKSYGGLKTSS